MGPCILGCTQMLGLDKDYHKDAGGNALPSTTCAALADAGLSCPAPDKQLSPEMKSVPGGYCIDTTEVTWGQ